MSYEPLLENSVYDLNSLYLIHTIFQKQEGNKSVCQSFGFFNVMMELVRNIWRKSIFVYKTGMQTSMRNSNTTSNIAEVAVFSRDGDSGLTITDAGDTKPKDDMIFNALGATDELSSYIGLAREFACDSKVEHPYVDKLKRVQMILFDLSHAISKSIPGKTKLFESKHTKDLEEWILEYANQLPPPEDYIIPGGGKACASLHVARTICRRAERNITSLVRHGALDKEAQTYLNRLSDFLLTVSRIAAKCDQRTENIYIPRAEVTEEK
ncbi:hypothetical protein KM043_015494 [Ampulex compressa]|nr:hypothetical protein KM043_015494 [Ampulex compressa]